MIDEKDIIFGFKMTEFYVTYLVYLDDAKYPWNCINFPNTKEEIAAIEKYRKEAADERIPKQHLKGTKLVAQSHTPCFAQLRYDLNTLCNGDKGLIARSIGKRRVLYLYRDDPLISDEDQKDWFTLAKKHGYLPRYVSVKQVLENKALLIDPDKDSWNMAYIYLSMARFIYAEPNYVKNVLTLVKKYGVDFTVAMAYATHFGLKASGHHFINSFGSYLGVRNLKDLAATPTHIGRIWGLDKFVKCKGDFEGKYDSTSFCVQNNVNRLAEKISKVCTIGLSDITNPKLATVIRGKSAEEVHGLYNGMVKHK